jgi:acetolactate synthase regulatory subunit
MIAPYHDLTVKLTDEEGGMHRMIGIVQKRGFDICGMYMPIDDDHVKTVRISVRPRHDICSVDILRKQILRMHNAVDVAMVAREVPKKTRNILHLFRRTKAKNA